MSLDLGPGALALSVALAFGVGCERSSPREGATGAAEPAGSTGSVRPEGSATPPALVAEADAPLAFEVEGETQRTLTKRQLVDAIPTVDARTFDPYYERTKAFRCLPMKPLLERGFPGRKNLEKAFFVLRADDGYTVPIEGERLLEDGSCLAVADLEKPSWEPIGQQKANPGPYYLIWRRPAQGNLERYPRPWQLAAIEITSFARQFPHTVPAGAGADAQRGFALFQEQCIRCHAINQEGGQVGPELNIPQNLLAYRPEAQVRAYVRDPTTFRYSKMPSFSHLSNADLDAIVAYLRAMGERQHDPKDAKAP